MNAGNPELFSERIVRLPEERSAVYWLENWRVLRRNWKLFLSIVLCAAAAGFIVSTFQTRVYHAVATIEVQGITDSFLKTYDGNPNASAESEVTDIQTQIRIIQSASLIQPVLERLGNTGFRNNETSREALRRAAKLLTVRPAGFTRIVEIASDSPDPRIAADFVNALSEEFMAEHVEARWQGSRRAAEKLKLALEDVRVKLEQSEQALQKDAHQSGLFMNADRSSVSEDKLRLLQGELSLAQADRIAKQSRFDAVSRNAARNLQALVEDPGMQASEAKLNDLQRQLAELSVTYTADYSKVLRLQAQIAPLETSIATAVSGTVDRIRSEFEQAREREEMLASAYREQSDVVSSDAEKKVHYDVLRREVDSTRTLYDTMLARVKEAAIASAIRGSNVRVLDPAKVPTEAYKPDRAQMSLLGLLAGLFLGSVVLVAREQTDRTIRSPGDIRIFLDLPELGTVPKFGGLPVAEPFRSIAASLLLRSLLGEQSEGNESGSRILAIASAQTGDGRTAVTVNLAVALAAIGKRVLVIDGDLHSPQIHRSFGGTNERGLAELLAVVTPLLPADIAQAFQKTSHPRLEFLAAGCLGASSSDSLYSRRLGEIVAHVRNIFDIVLIDTAPLLQTSDARVFGRAADAVVFVARAGKTDREPAMAVRQRLAEDKTLITGCILNEYGARDTKLALGLNAPAPQTLARHTSA